MKQLELLRELIRNQPFLELMGIEVIDAGAGWVREKLSIRPAFLQPDVVHGGAIYALADTAAAHSVLTLIYPAEWTTTVEQKISFLRPVTTGALICNAKVVQLGKRLAFSDAQIVNDNGDLIATSSATLMRLTRQV
ncbi:MAG: PaaI family thioesterase [Acidobacteria bacterium]|nr:PaaI family thioesterase [Acidobacteriota bacterium]